MQFVMIEWVDSCGCSPNWRELSELPKPKPSPCRSVGWLADDGEDWKTIVPHVADSDEGSGDQGCGEMCIPTCAIVRMHALSDPRPSSVETPDKADSPPDSA